MSEQCKGADFTISGGLIRTPPTYAPDDASFRMRALGTVVMHWFGDSPALGTNVGQIPGGYLTAPLYKEWLRGVHGAGYFSYGPFERLDGVGSFQVWFFIEVTNRGGAGDDVLTADVVDHDNGGSPLASGTFKVSDFPVGLAGFTIYSPILNIPSGNHRIESRIFARGGASLKLWGIRWEIDTL